MKPNESLSSGMRENIPLTHCGLSSDKQIEMNRYALNKHLDMETKVQIKYEEMFMWQSPIEIYLYLVKRDLSWKVKLSSYQLIFAPTFNGGHELHVVTKTIILNVLAPQGG